MIMMILIIIMTPFHEWPRLFASHPLAQLHGVTQQAIKM
jgi:hypothetical protein